MVNKDQNEEATKSNKNSPKLSGLKLDIGKMREEQEEVLLFFSFDIVNSSLYKTINYYGWSFVLGSLFEEIRKIVKSKIPGVELWRILGDEIIFIVKITEEEQIYEYMSQVYNILTDIVEKIKCGEIFNNKKLSNKEFNTMKLQNILSLKGAAWIAIVYRKADDSIDVQYENISKEYVGGENYHICEFLGNDIDAGFRISKQTCDRRLVISFELAYLLSRKTEELSKLFIITYKKLKGIWNNKLYPIIWYYDKEKSDNIKFEESFYYDEIEECELVREYFTNCEKKNEEKNITYQYMYTDIEQALDKILKNRNLKEKITKIQLLIKKTRNVGSKNNKYTKIPQLEFQCVAVCYDEKNDKILVAKRKSDKNNYPNKWEFGSVTASLNEPIIDTIVNTYNKIFNLNVELIIDETRSGKQPIPIAIYEVSKEDGEILKGVIVIAKIKGSSEAKLAEASNYSECKWIGRDEISKYDKENGIPDFSITINTVFDNIEKYKGR